MSANKPICPECGKVLRQTRRGATLRKRGPAYVCPQAEADRVADENGHLHMVAGSAHKTVRVYEPRELQEVAA